MEGEVECEIHGRPQQRICVKCKRRLCNRCAAIHTGMHHGDIISIAEYAREFVLPRYEEVRRTAEQNRKSIDVFFHDLATTLPTVRAALQQLKARLENMIQEFNRALSILDKYRGDIQSACECIKGSTLADQTKLSEAINHQDLEHIFTTKHTIDRVYARAIDDQGRPLLQAVKKSLERLCESKEFERLKEGLAAWLEVVEKSLQPTYCALPTFSQGVYYTCDPIEYRQRLCRFDLPTQRVQVLDHVPQYCAVLQSENKIFVSGGGYPPTKGHLEYVELLQHFVPRASLSLPKYGHSLVATSTLKFASVGGHDGSSNIGHCEEYDIAENAWRPLPSLNRPRVGSAVCVFKNVELFAFGGECESLESLDLKVRLSWQLVSLFATEVSVYTGAAAMQISHDEILVLGGSNKADVGVFKVKSVIIKKQKTVLKPDYYAGNSMCLIGDIVYFAGCRGHIHMYHIQTKQFQELDFKDIAEGK